MRRPPLTANVPARKSPLFAIAGVALVLATSLFLQSSSAAQAPGSTGGGSLSVSPAVVETEAEPGQSLSVAVTVGNLSDGVVNVHTTPGSFVLDETVDPAFASIFDASSWFSTDDRTVTLQPRERRTVSYTVAVPAGAEPGGHYAALYFERAGAPPSGGSPGTAVAARVGVLVLITVRGDIHEHLEAPEPVNVDRFSVGERSTMSITLSNDGSVHQAPRIRMDVTDVLGRHVKQLDVSAGVVLPHTDRTYTAHWDHGWRFGLYRVGATVTAGKQRSFDVPVGASWFVVFSWQLVAVVLAVVAAAGVVLFVRRLRRNRARRRRREAVQAAVEAARRSDEPSG